MAGLTRRELKQDELRTSLQQLEQFAKEHYREVVVSAVAVLLMAAGVLGWRTYSERREAEANAALGAALKTFRASVGSPTPDLQGTAAPTFATASDKYKKALQQFTDIMARFPRQPAAEIARYHAGICQSELGNHDAAIKTLQEATRTRDANLASLAKFALAGEYLKAGRQADAVKIYQQLADHPTTAVPRATALVALADALRARQPGQARQLYERVQKEFASDTTLTTAMQQQIDSLPH